MQAAKVQKARGASKPKKGKEGFRETPLPKWHSINIGAVKLLVKNPSHPRSEKVEVRPDVLRVDGLGAGKRGHRETLFSPNKASSLTDRCGSPLCT